jgi:hypothetical protein
MERVRASFEPVKVVSMWRAALGLASGSAGDA